MDYYSDSGHTFAKLFVDYELPEYVKAANALEEDELKSLSKKAFADQENRMFPIQDAAQVFTSAAYAFARPGEVNPAVISRIKKAAGVFKIDDDLKKLETHVLNLFAKPNEVKEASFEGPKKAPFIIEFKSAGIDRLEGCGSDGVKRAEGRFLKAWPQIDFNRRQKIATDLIAAAAENGTSLSDETLKVAGQAEIDHNQLRDQFNARIAYIPDMMSRSTLVPAFNLKMAELNAAKTPEEIKTAGNAIAAFLGELDATHKTARFYGERLEGPHQAVFNKIAKPGEILTIGRHTYPGRRWHGDGEVFDQAIITILGPKAAELKTASGEYDPAKLAAIGNEEADLIKRLVG